MLDLEASKDPSQNLILGLLSVISRAGLNANAELTMGGETLELKEMLALKSILSGNRPVIGNDSKLALAKLLEDEELSKGCNFFFLLFLDLAIYVTSGLIPLPSPATLPDFIVRILKKVTIHRKIKSGGHMVETQEGIFLIAAGRKAERISYLDKNTKFFFTFYSRSLQSNPPLFFHPAVVTFDCEQLHSGRECWRGGGSFFPFFWRQGRTSETPVVEPP